MDPVPHLVGPTGGPLEASADIVESIDAEVVRWETSLELLGLLRQHGSARKVHPDPHEEHGLPDGWVIRSRFADLIPGIDTVLIQRPSGDWLIVRHSRSIEDTRVLMGATTLTGLYKYAALADRRGPYGRLTQWLFPVLMRMFDTTDPVEAAEQMLLAAGAVDLTPPLASLTPGYSLSQGAERTLHGVDANPAPDPSGDSPGPVSTT